MRSIHFRNKAFLILRILKELKNRIEKNAISMLFSLFSFITKYSFFIYKKILLVLIRDFFRKDLTFISFFFRNSKLTICYLKKAINNYLKVTFSGTCKI